MGFLLGSLRALGTSGAVFFPSGAVFWVALGVPLAVGFSSFESLSFRRLRRRFFVPLRLVFRVLGALSALSVPLGTGFGVALGVPLAVCFLVFCLSRFAPQAHLFVSGFSCL